MVLTVDRFTISVPAGWTALDSTFLRDAMPMEAQTCTFEGEGRPVAGPEGGGSVGGSTEETESCVSQPMEMPIGIPVLQLTKDDPADLDRTVCGRLSAVRAAGEPSLGPAPSGLFVALTPDAAEAPAWPVPVEDGSGPCGQGLYARFSAAGETYLAFVRLGSDVSPRDREALLGAVGGMVEHDASITRPVLPGPAVGIASGDVDGRRWQLLAGLELGLDARATPTLWARQFRTDGTEQGLMSIPWRGSDEPRIEESSFGAASDPALVAALLPAGTLDPTWIGDDGSTVPLRTAPAPALMAFGEPEFDGRIGWTVASGIEGSVQSSAAGTSPVQDAIDGASGSNDWYSWRTTIASRGPDTWRFIVSAVSRGQPRREQIVWSGEVPASSRGMDLGSMNVVAIDMSDRVPGNSVLVFAFLPADAEHVHVSFPDGSGVRSSRADASEGTFETLADLDPHVTLFGNSYEGTVSMSPLDVEALDADLEPLLGAAVSATRAAG